jgi:hypothetical protein
MGVEFYGFVRLRAMSFGTHVGAVTRALLGHVVDDFSGSRPVCSYTHKKMPQ